MDTGSHRGRLKMRTVMHIDFNSYFASVEQQANPRLRGKPIGVTGGDRDERTVLGAASVEAKALGVKTGMSIPEAKRLCPNLILVKGDSSKYLETTRRFLNILKNYSPDLEIFSIDECFLEFNNKTYSDLILIAQEIKDRIRVEVGEWISVSVGVSYNKLMAKLAGSLYKPDGLVVIEDNISSQYILDRVELDDICGIGYRIKKRLNNMGVINFQTLRKVPLINLLSSFKSYGQILYNMARGEDYTPVTPFYQRERVKSVGHRHTLASNTTDEVIIKTTLLKLTELIARSLRAKKMIGKTISCYFRYADFSGIGKQATINYSSNGGEIFEASWQIFYSLWNGNPIRMIGVSVSNLKSSTPHNLSFLEDRIKEEVILKAIDSVNDKYGEFTLKRAVLINSERIYRKPNSFLSDRRFKL